MTTVPNGLVGGLIAALVAGGVTRTLRDGPSLVAALAAERTGRDPGAYWWAPAVQVLAGSLAGGGLVALELYVLDVLGVPPARVEALGLAVAWALLLLVASLGLRALLRAAPPDRHTAGRLFAGHLLYGLALGLWLRATWVT